METPEVKTDIKAKGKAPVKKSPAVAIDYEKLADMVASRMAPMVRVASQEVHAEQFPTGQHDDISIDAAHGGGVIQPVDGPLNKDYLDELAFMEEMVTVVVHDSTDPAAENPVQAANNGRTVYFQRGVPTQVRRCIVDSLIVKVDHVTTPEYTNEGGERLRKISRQSALKYPFSIMGDSAKGMEWLRRRMAEK